MTFSSIRFLSVVFLLPTVLLAILASDAQTQEVVTGLTPSGLTPSEITPSEMTLSNIALGKPATQSSEFEFASFPASLATDGDLGNFTHTSSSDANANWQVNLVGDFFISEITLFNRVNFGNCCGERLRDITVQILDPGMNPVFTSTLLNPENVLDSPENLTLTLADFGGTAVQGSFVKVLRTADPDGSGFSSGDINDANTLSLGEVQVFGTPVNPITEFVPWESLWSYRDDGSNQGTAWRGSQFDDSSWQTGPAQLGYGDGDEATVVSFGGNGNDKHATTYFRQTFEVDDADRVESLTSLLLRDDAAAVYLNGIEIFRDDNLSASAAYNTFATSVGEENGTIAFVIEPVLLVDGENVLAVEVHQASANSSDISFDFQLTGVVNPVPEPTTFALTALGLFGFVARGRRRRARSS